MIKLSLFYKEVQKSINKITSLEQKSNLLILRGSYILWLVITLVLVMPTIYSTKSFNINIIIMLLVGICGIYILKYLELRFYKKINDEIQVMLENKGNFNLRLAIELESEIENQINKISSFVKWSLGIFVTILALGITILSTTYISFLSSHSINDNFFTLINSNIAQFISVPFIIILFPTIILYIIYKFFTFNLNLNLNIIRDYKYINLQQSNYKKYE